MIPTEEYILGKFVSFQQLRQYHGYNFADMFDDWVFREWIILGGNKQIFTVSNATSWSIEPSLPISLRENRAYDVDDYLIFSGGEILKQDCAGNYEI